jgi:DNA-binding CsgD family transcriptional regulator
VGLVTEIPSSAAQGKMHRFQLGAVATPYGYEPFGEKGLAMMQLLVPSFLAGVGMVAETERWRSSLGAALDAADAAAWVFTPTADVLSHRNESARLLMARDAQRCAVEAAVTRLARELGQSVDCKKTGRSSALPVDATSCVRTPTAAYSIRGCRVAAGRLAPGPSILVVVRRTTPAPPDAAELQARHGLTRRELEVAELVWGGFATAEVAIRLGISIHTARRHMERLYRKLGVHSHADAHRVLHEPA